MQLRKIDDVLNILCVGVCVCVFICGLSPKTVVYQSIFTSIINVDHYSCVMDVHVVPHLEHMLLVSTLLAAGTSGSGWLLIACMCVCTCTVL